MTLRVESTVFLLLLWQVFLPAQAQTPQLFTYEVENEYPHDQTAFTQGLQYERSCDNITRQCQEYFWESTGLYGQSSIRKVALTTGKVLNQTKLASQHFAEGLVRLGDFIYQITWQGPTSFKYNASNLKLVEQFNTPLSDGWGLTSDGKFLIATDSSPNLYFIDPVTYKLNRTLVIKDGTTPLKWVNELEYINGELWGNIWQRECIARINVTTGQVTSWVMMQGLRDNLLQRSTTNRGNMDVLNGIAWDPHGKRLFVTGKNWPSVFEIKVKAFSKRHPLTVEQARAKCWPPGH
mmetsp:Transcript_19288/g.41693  ORF Transcript_19288/g.41693 Transcript_19288/m.41693 type:complete len:293 (+) Transcript_19288:89-967(+)|eukprot:CAMPEP_0202902804 /NCGR_PEP_ID=MMETSP1392-20130828/17058_1 /ASSEMBLY_ACC=CAM_ASM_000868 /TAXON_ID=225041 /ORGANISM="Chlamydomonas chlamydogama, Strain SAG 11-48b" /LENGTH=292 /DNA_ID=CAMNT_0049589611 /DNA_START=73 /DNA_END=951 /DNA_ORIENTATION=+